MSDKFMGIGFLVMMFILLGMISVSLQQGRSFTVWVASVGLAIIGFLAGVCITRWRFKIQ